MISFFYQIYQINYRNCQLEQNNNRQYYLNQLRYIMVKAKIDFYDSVQFSGEWEFVKQKKQRIKTKTQKDVNSQFYIMFRQPKALFLFVYFSLANEQSFEFQKVKPLIQRLRGQSEDQHQKYKECKDALCLNWDGSTPLPQIVRAKKEVIASQQKNLLQLSQKLSEQQLRQLLVSGLSQRKIHLDLHTNDGQNQQVIIPAVKNINDCITIICQSDNKWLLAFLSHIQPVKQQEKQEEKQETETKPVKQNKQIPNPDERPIHPAKQQQTTNNVAQTFRDRPIMNVPNPDDRPLAQPINEQRSTSSRQIINPDERLLPPPPANYITKPNDSSRLSSSRPNEGSRVSSNKQEQDDYKDLRVIGKSYGQRVEQPIIKIAPTANRVQQPTIKVEPSVKHVQESRGSQKTEPHQNSIQSWGNYIVAAGIIALAIKVFRT